MRYNIYSIILASVASMALTGCDKESTFNMNPGEGQLNCRTLTVDYINNNQKVRSSEIELGDFTVNFVNTATNDTARSFTYAEMPEIVSLPQGNYRAEASYGDNPIADWEAPYYLGDTDFEIKSGEITDDVDPVECVLSNIRVRVNISDLNLGLLGDDAQVVVHAGKEGELTYNLSTTNKAGYFRFIENSHTLTAEFSGTVDGKYVSAAPLIFENVEAGKAYDINFTINRPDNMEPGTIVVGGESGSEITVNATIAIKDETLTIDPNEPEDNILVDDMRPVNGSSEIGDEPGDEPTPSTNGPTIETEAPLQLGVEYIIEADETGEEALTPVIFTVTSETGITGFEIEIESALLNEDVLSGVGLTTKLNLITPGQYKEKLEGLGFPTEKDVEDQVKCEFNISKFVPLLIMLADGEPAEHKFHLSVKDNNGMTTGTIWLKSE